MTKTDWLLLMCLALGFIQGVFVAYMRWGRRARLADANMHIMAIGAAESIERATGEARRALQKWQATRYDMANDGSSRVPIATSLAMSRALGALEHAADVADEMKTPNVAGNRQPR